MYLLFPLRTVDNVIDIQDVINTQSVFMHDICDRKSTRNLSINQQVLSLQGSTVTERKFGAIWSARGSLNVFFAVIWPCDNNTCDETPKNVPLKY